MITSGRRCRSPISLVAERVVIEAEKKQRPGTDRKVEGSSPPWRTQRMTISDACPTRNQVRAHKAVRTLLDRMNIQLVEPERTGVKGVCCGDSFWGVLPTEQVKEKMIERASEMPAENVVVYCVSCAKSMFVGGKRPRYLVDLLFEEETLPKTYGPDEWHRELEEYILAH